MRTTTIVAMLAMALGATASTARPVAQVSPAVTAALANPARADQAGDDARREAAAVLAFSGVKPGDVVVDYLPGRYYWTRILSGVVGPKGNVFATWPAALAERANKARADTFDTWHLANVTYVANPTDAPIAAQPVDLFWTVQNYHDMANKGAGEAGLATFNAAVFRLLRHGGTYLVIDHADAAGTGIAGTETRHRIDPAAVRRQIEAAGFRFVGASTVLANPADDHTKNVFDAAIRGHTDQFAFKFRKP